MRLECLRVFVPRAAIAGITDALRRSSLLRRIASIELLRRERREQCCGRCVVAESFADVREAIDVPRAENEASAELKRVASQLVLPMPRRFGAFAAFEIIGAQHVKQAGNAQFGKFVSATLFVNQQGKVDSRLVLKNARVVTVAEANGRERSTFIPKSLLMFAQLRDVLAAKNSSVMAEKNEDRGVGLPKRSQENFTAESVGKGDPREPLAEGFRHWPSLTAKESAVKTQAAFPRDAWIFPPILRRPKGLRTLPRRLQ